MFLNAKAATNANKRRKRNAPIRVEQRLTGPPRPSFTFDFFATIAFKRSEPCVSC